MSATMGFLGFNFNLVDQLRFYGRYHNNPVNQGIHFVFVPLILWTVAVWLAYTPAFCHCDLASFVPALLAGAAQYLVFNGSFVLLAVYSLYYLTLEHFAGFTWTLFVALPLWGTAVAFRQVVPQAWSWAVGVHVLSWIMQVYFGHMVAEKRKPALLDSFFQSLVLAPLFVWFELLFTLGYRPALYAEVQQLVAQDITEWRTQAAPLLSSAVESKEDEG